MSNEQGCSFFIPHSSFLIDAPCVLGPDVVYLRLGIRPIQERPMHPFDINCMLGPTNTDREPSFRTPENLLAEMDRVGLTEALV